MARIIAIAHTKGGVGKSTLAVNLAVAAATAGLKTLLIDADPQGSSAQFLSVRADERPQFQAVQLTKPTLHRQMGELSAPYEYVFIDVGGRDAPVLRSAIGAADTVLIPMVPSAFDAWASEDILRVIEEIRVANGNLRVYVVPNQVTGTISAREALAVLRDGLAQQTDVVILDVALYSRTAWPRAVGEGLSVAEWEPEGKAAAELGELVRKLGITP